MDPLWLLLLLPCAALSGWLTARREQRTTSKRKLPESYFKGLNFLLNEQPDQALRVFLEEVAVDSKTIELHFALGNLFRRRGEIERATQIHQNLVSRADIEDWLRELALFELAQDYFKAGLLGRAENLFQKICRLPASAYRERANRFLLQIYDQEKEWRSAIIVAKELTRISSSDLSDSLAQYYCELAERAITEGQNKRADEFLGIALQHDPHCVRAIIQSGRLASMRGNHIDAIAVWRSLEEFAPEALGEVIDHLANSYEAIGDQENYMQFLKDAMQHNSDWRIVAALVDLAKSDDDGEAGQTLLLNLTQKYPGMEGIHDLLKSPTTEHSWSQKNKNFTMWMDLLSQIIGQERGYYCNNCRFSSNSLHWQCPGCKSWGTVQQRITPLANKPSTQLGVTI